MDESAEAFMNRLVADHSIVENLDPGIRAEVAMLRIHRFKTTDSGDGVSKPKEHYESGEALPFKHVAMEVDPFLMRSEAHRCAELLGSKWNVEASYDTLSRKAILFARERTEAER